MNKGCAFGLVVVLVPLLSGQKTENDVLCAARLASEPLSNRVALSTA